MAASQAADSAAASKTESEAASESVRMGRYGQPAHVLVQISDPHFLAGGEPLYGLVDTEPAVRGAMRLLEHSGLRPDAVLVTGDVTDRGEADAYRRIRAIVEPTAKRLGAELVWVMGNHDSRRPFRRELLGAEATTEPVDGVLTVNGLRIISLDSSVPGYHHGDLTDDQLIWLREELAEPAPDGTILALHHPPLPTSFPVLTILELQHQERLAEAIAGSDIRAILAGHLHYATTGTFAGIPVSVAAATSYTMDLAGRQRELSGVDGGQSINLIRIYDDQIVTSVLPLGNFQQVIGFDEAFLSRMEQLDPDARIEAFSRFPNPE